MDKKDSIYQTPPHDPDDGMQRAVDHADAITTNWSDMAYALLLHFALQEGNFIAEEAREFAHKKGLPRPPDGRAWGAVIKRAVNRGLIRKVSYRTDQYGSPKAVWQRHVTLRQHESS
jgi:hypothetical protein